MMEDVIRGIEEFDQIYDSELSCNPKMMEETAFIRGMEGFDEIYDSNSEFKKQLKQVDLSSKQFDNGWVFWRTPERYQQFESLISSTNSYISPTQIIKDKIQRVLVELASTSWELYHPMYVVQFWAAEVDQQQQLYLTTSEQPFAVGRDLCKGLCWYRQRCVAHRYRVDEGAREDELGAVGRAYRNKHLESSPDLRLYSTHEFPLRDYAAWCGLRNYYALPVFDLLKQNCYGIIEALCFQDLHMEMLSSLEKGLKAGELRATHVDIHITKRAVHIEIKKMLELATTAMPQLRMAQVWVPCHECSSTSDNLSCLEIADSIIAQREVVNLIWESYDFDMSWYLRACKLQKLQIGKYTMVSSNPCICRNICDFSISENPFAHYAQKARLSFCLKICLQSSYDSRDIYLGEFFFQFNNGEDAFVGSVLPLLLRTMEMELKSFEFAYRGYSGEELVVEVLKENMFGSEESSQSKAFRYESIKYKYQRLEEYRMLVAMKECNKRYLLPGFRKYLQKADLQYIRPSKKCKHGWFFWSTERQVAAENEVNCNASILQNPIQEKIKVLMREIASNWPFWNNYCLAQFWAPKMDVNRCYLDTSDQPFALGCLQKGLAFFRRRCMEHYYFVDEGTKEYELGPPGRVFLYGHPEITPDLCLYSPSEFALRNDAAHSCLRTYFALPVFDLDQHKCVGVLELVQFCNSDYTFEFIGKALEVANLSSPHINFRPSFQGNHLPVNNVKCRQLVLNEIKESCKLFKEVPQLKMVEFWVPHHECLSVNNTWTSMEMIWATNLGWELNSPIRQAKHIQSRKGIAGMALVSENKACFCRNLCEFSIVEQPLAHYAQHGRLDICFAICLQSWYTGDLLYLVELYLNQGPRKYDYIRSFLGLLLQIMQQTLTSFKVASGQELGDKLVVEVIEFSQVNEVDVVELDQSDVVPITFKFVNYRGHKHSGDNKHDVQFFPDDGVESVSIVAEAEHISNSAANLKKNEAAKGTKEGKSETGLNITFMDLQSHFGHKRKDAAKELCVSESTFKRLCRKYGIQRWPQNGKYKKNPSLFMTESANQSGRDSQPNMDGLPNSSNLPSPEMPQTDPKSSQHLITQPKVDMVVIYAKYESKTIKFKLYHTAGMEKLVSEVAMRLKLDIGSFEMEYLDEIKEKILLTCDADLELCLESVAAEGKCYIQISSLKNSAVMGKPYIQVVPSSTPPSSSADTQDPRHHHAIKQLLKIQSWLAGQQ